MLKCKSKRAQSTLEYIIVLTAVIGLIIYAASQWIGKGVKTSLDNAESAIGTAADHIK